MDFNLSESLTAFQDADKSTFEVRDEGRLLQMVTDALGVSSESIGREEIFDPLQDLVHAFPKLNQKSRSALAYLISSSTLNIAQTVIHLVDEGDNESFSLYKKYLELYGYLNYCFLDYLREEDHSAMSKTKKQIDKKSLENFENHCQQIETAMESISKIFQIKLSRLFVTTPERDLFISLFTRPIWGLMENKERMKVPAVKLLMFKCICEAVKFHGHASVAQSSIVSNLTFFEHLNTPLAELLASLADTYDYGQLIDEVLRELSNKDFDPNDTTGPKSVAAFLSKLSELVPRIVMKQMTLIAQFLDNGSSSLRCAVIEVCGNIIVNMCSEDELFEMHKNNLDRLIALLEQRLLDQSHYARAKSLQSLITLCDSKRSILKVHRTVFTELAVRSLEDKSSHVRRYAIKLLSKLILTHPFSAMHGSQLNLTAWRQRLEAAEEQMCELDPSFKEMKRLAEEQRERALKDADSDDMEVDPKEDEDDDNDADMSQADEEPIAEQPEAETDAVEQNEEHANISVINDEPIHRDQDTLNSIAKLKLTMQYYLEAIEFIELLGKGVKIASQLLYSKNKTDVIETMDFFVIADAFDIEGKDSGIRRMLHLVWMKNGNDEGDNIPKKLVECYSQLFLSAPSNISAEAAAAFVAKNLCKLTFGASVAELASLERLICMMYDDKLINELVIRVLWQIYCFETPDDADDSAKVQYSEQRLGSIIVLGIVGLSNHLEVLKGLDVLLGIGLGQAGRDNLTLQKYSCIALQRIVPSSKDAQATKQKVPREEEVVEKLCEALLYYNEDEEWYGIAEEVIDAIYKISEHPDQVCTSLIKKKTACVFKVESESDSDVANLSQTLFIVGHVAIKTLVHLEKLEAEFKNKKHLAEQEKNRNKSEDAEHQNELEMIGGTSEDDFADAVHIIKEQELLYNENSLLSRYKEVVKVICSNNVQYDDPVLQRSATLCLSKLMLISSKYCEENLPLLITIMERSQDPIIRSNAVLALGDMAVVFNNLVDSNTDYLYRRLNDENIMVQRTCLMTITFLILAGQVKVKGQLSQMAKCLEHKDQGISDMCKMFFTELATKDNAIYNSFIDLFSGLSNDDELQEAKFHRIVKFVISFIDSDKHIKQLTAKLLQRLTNSKNEKEWNNVAFVLNTLPIKDELLEEVKTVIDGGFKLVTVN